MNCLSNEQLAVLLSSDDRPAAAAEHFNQCEACQRRADLLMRGIEPLIDELPLLLEPPGRSDSAALNADTARPSQTQVGRSTPRSHREASGSDEPARGVTGEGADRSQITFARHRLLGKLGSGGMGIVCLAEHTGLGANRAIKFLAQRRVSNSESIERFRREWRSMGQIEHPNLARAYDCGEESGVHFLTLEYIPGRSLQRLINDAGPLTPGQAAEAGLQIANGLAALHEQGFVHRDLKPSNAVLGLDGKVKIIDLGLACLNEELADDMLTSDQQLVGSPAYMAPEQFQQDCPRTAAADLYSLGCTLFTLLAGEPPYAVTGRSVWDVAADHAAPIAPDIRSVRPDVSSDFALIIQRLIAAAPEARPPNASMVAEQLQPHADRDELIELGASAATEPVLELPADLIDRLSDSASGPILIEAGVSSASPTIQLLPDKAVTSKRFTKPSIRMALFAGAVLVAGIGLTLVDLNRQTPALGTSDSTAAIHGVNGTSRLKPVLGSGSVPASPAGADSVVSGANTPQSGVSSEIESPAFERSVWPVRQLADRTQEPQRWPPGEPLSVAALTQAPASIPGVQSWTWETRSARGSINAIRRSFDGTRIATGGADGCLRIYAFPDLKLQRLLVGHYSIESIRWQTDSILIVADAGGIVRLWDVDRGVVLRTWDNEATPAWDADLSPDGTRVAIAGVGRGCLVGEVDDPSLNKLRFTAETYAAGWAPTDNILVSTTGQTFRIFDLDIGNDPVTSRTMSGRRIKCVEWHPNGDLVAIVSEWGDECVLVSPADGEAAVEFEFPKAAAQLCRWSPDATQLAILTRNALVLANAAGETLRQIRLTTGTLRTFDWIDGRTLIASKQHGEGLVIIDSEAAAFNEQGRQDVCAGTFIEASPELTVVAAGKGLFEMRSGTLRPFAVPEEHTEQMTFGLGVAASARPSEIDETGPLVAATHRESVYWSECAGESWQDSGLPVAKVVDIAGHPHRHEFMVLYENGELWRWKLDQPAELDQKLPGANFHSQVSWSPDGTWLAATVEGRLVAWKPSSDASPESTVVSAAQRKFDFDWKISNGGAEAAWSPDSTMIATKSTAGVLVYSLITGDRIAVLTGQTHWLNYGIAWSPDNRSVAALTGTSLRVWETDSWQQKMVIPVNSSLSGSRPLAWHPSGKTLLHAAGDATCREFDATTGECVSTSLLLTPERFAVFTSDGQPLQLNGVRDDLVAVIKTETGQQMISASELQSLQQHLLEKDQTE